MSGVRRLPVYGERGICGARHEDQDGIAQTVYEQMKYTNEEAYMMTKERFVQLFDFSTLRM